MTRVRTLVPSRPRQRSLVATVGLTAVPLVLFGCTSRPRVDYGQLNLVEVGGVVTLDGRPLPKATIIFEADDRTFSLGKTDAAGRYQLWYNSEKSGVSPGRKIVRISTWPGAFTEAAAPTEEARAAPGSSQELVPVRYNTRSELTVVVESGTHSFPFDLRSSLR